MRYLTRSVTGVRFLKKANQYAAAMLNLTFMKCSVNIHSLKLTIQSYIR
jgi:hypothetical protein